MAAYYTPSIDKWRPDGNPFWVVSTSGDIMRGHNEIFNPRSLSFMQQVYLGVVEEPKHKPVGSATVG